jgi:adenylosuccinate synthase
MTNKVAIGSQWGDEGKAKIIDYLAENADVIVRFQGGANAGHTVCVGEQKFIFHMVPSGIMYDDTTCVIGNGVVFDPEQFMHEIDELEDKGIATRGRVFVSDRAHVVLPYHKWHDALSERSLQKGKIGTTCRGIGPAYADKANRSGIRCAHLLDEDTCVETVRRMFAEKKAYLEKMYDTTLDEDCDAAVDAFRRLAPRIRPYISDTAHYLYQARRQNKRVLFEGAQGTFLDIDHGTYPYVTSSNTTAGAACTGSGVGPDAIDEVVGIVKAYTTRVGNGPFPTELDNDTGAYIREKGSEFGATTGRPRRCGWLDTVMLRRAIELNGITELALTKIDVLSGCDEIKICVGYEIDGKKCEQFPARLEVLQQCRPVYETVPGWKEDISAASCIGDMPAAVRDYISRIESLCHDTPVRIVSVGPGRAQTIEKH